MHAAPPPDARTYHFDPSADGLIHDDRGCIRHMRSRWSTCLSQTCPSLFVKRAGCVRARWVGSDGGRMSALVSHARVHTCFSHKLRVANGVRSRDRESRRGRRCPVDVRRSSDGRQSSLSSSRQHRERVVCPQRCWPRPHLRGPNDFVVEPKGFHDRPLVAHRSLGVLEFN